VTSTFALIAVKTAVKPLQIDMQLKQPAFYKQSALDAVQEEAVLYQGIDGDAFPPVSTD